MKTTVVVPTYRRPTDLSRCLQALQRQIRLADEVIVVVRDTDADTQSLLQSLAPTVLPLQIVTVVKSGVIAAMNAGLNAASGEIISFTDDDAAPHPDWLKQIEAHFLADDRVGGVGGRDLIQWDEPWLQETRSVVGQLQWHGRLIGNHHLGTGQARQVDVLKGVNMSFRRTAIADLRFDDRMLGSGAQVHFEVAFCLSLRRKGWTLIYDPAILVDHYVAQRFDEDQRSQFNAIAVSNAAHNETLAVLDHFSPIQQLMFALWAIAIGSSQAFGLIQWMRYLPSQGSLATQKCFASLRGRWQGLLTWLQPSNSHSSCFAPLPKPTK